MKYLVITPHTSNYPNPINLQAGDRVQVGKTDANFPGWIWVTTADGNQGWAPVQYFQVDNSGNVAIALKSYSAQELNTRVGEILTLSYELNGWGWVENEEHSSGWVPMENIQPIDKQ